MTPEQAGQVLAVAAALDPRLRPPSQDDAILRARAWASVIHPWIDATAGQWAVRKHYATSSDSVMPVHVNRICSAARQDKDMRLPIEAAVAARENSVPMPDEFKEAIRKIGLMPK